MKTLLVYAKNYGKFPKNFIHNILWGCFYESCVGSTGIIQIGNNIFFEKKLRTKQKPLLQQ